jgi:hypothetical protein
MKPTLPVLEDDGLDVGRVDHAVDQGEFDLRQLGGHRFHRRGLGEAHRDDDVGAAPRHVAQGLLALRFGRGLELHVGDVGRLPEALGAVEGRLVEGLIELASHIVEDPGGHLVGTHLSGLGGADRHEPGDGEAGKNFAHEICSLSCPVLSARGP